MTKLPEVTPKQEVEQMATSCARRDRHVETVRAPDVPRGDPERRRVLAKVF